MQYKRDYYVSEAIDEKVTFQIRYFFLEVFLLFILLLLLVLFIKYRSLFKENYK
jgi:hypothetical protein